MAYKLVIEDDDGKTQTVPLVVDEITIGRKEGNTIRLTERNVSRKHAKLAKSNGTVFIEDLASHNGIKVNGDRIAGRAPIAEGDRIQIGDYQLALKLDKSTATDESRGDDKTTPFLKDDVRAAGPAGAPVATASRRPRARSRSSRCRARRRSGRRASWWCRRTSRARSGSSKRPRS